MIVTERGAETQAEGEAGYMDREPDVGFDPGSLQDRALGQRQGPNHWATQGSPRVVFLSTVLSSISMKKLKTPKWKTKSIIIILFPPTSTTLQIESYKTRTKRYKQRLPIIILGTLIFITNFLIKSSYPYFMVSIRIQNAIEISLKITLKIKLLKY